MRTTGEIIANPLSMDTILARLLGYCGTGKYIWFPCPLCGNYRWIANRTSAKKRVCCDCSTTCKYRPDAIGEYRTISTNDIPKEGDLIRCNEIGHAHSIYKWTRCPVCSNCRWLEKDTLGVPLCRSCANKRKYYVGSLNSQWKGGRLDRGYIRVRIYKDNPYFSMADRFGYIAEHRLVMAEHLGRCLERWEIVHHKHTRFPAGSVDDKQDNRIENLELLPSRYLHNAITILENQVHELTKQVTGLQTKVKLCEWRIRELETEKETITIIKSDLVFRRMD